MSIVGDTWDGISGDIRNDSGEVEPKAIESISVRARDSSTLASSTPTTWATKRAKPDQLSVRARSAVVRRDREVDDSNASRRHTRGRKVGDLVVECEDGDDIEDDDDVDDEVEGRCARLSRAVQSSANEDSSDSISLTT